MAIGRDDARQLCYGLTRVLAWGCSQPFDRILHARAGVCPARFLFLLLQFCGWGKGWPPAPALLWLPAHLHLAKETFTHLIFLEPLTCVCTDIELRAAASTAGSLSRVLFPRCTGCAFYKTHEPSPDQTVTVDRQLGCVPRPRKAMVLRGASCENRLDMWRGLLAAVTAPLQSPWNEAPWAGPCWVSSVAESLKVPGLHAGEYAQMRESVSVEWQSKIGTGAQSGPGARRLCKGDCGAKCQRLGVCMEGSECCPNYYGLAVQMKHASYPCSRVQGPRPSPKQCTWPRPARRIR